MRDLGPGSRFATPRRQMTSPLAAPTHRHTLDLNVNASRNAINVSSICDIYTTASNHRASLCRQILRVRYYQMSDYFRPIG